ncbi:MAG: FIG01127708: hypothetical protein, partial [uncultured Solirubrobacterales bacterium]
GHSDGCPAPGRKRPARAGAVVSSPARRGRGAARRVRGLGIQGGALHRAARRRPGDPAHPTAARARRGGRRGAGQPRDRPPGVGALRSQGQRRQRAVPRRAQASPARGARRRRRHEPQAQEGQPAARAALSHRARTRPNGLPVHPIPVAALPSAGARARPRRPPRPRRLAFLFPRGGAGPAHRALRPGHPHPGLRLRGPGHGLSRAGTRHRVSLRRRQAGGARGRHLRGLAGLLLRRDRRLPARQGGPAAGRPRRDALQRGLRARLWGRLPGDRLRAAAVRGRASALRRLPAAAAGAAPRRLLRDLRPHRRPRHPHPSPADPAQPDPGPRGRPERQGPEAVGPRGGERLRRDARADPVADPDRDHRLGAARARHGLGLAGVADRPRARRARRRRSARRDRRGSAHDGARAARGGDHGEPDPARAPRPHRPRPVGPREAAADGDDGRRGGPRDRASGLHLVAERRLPPDRTGRSRHDRRRGPQCRESPDRATLGRFERRDVEGLARGLRSERLGPGRGTAEGDRSAGSRREARRIAGRRGAECPRAAAGALGSPAAGAGLQEGRRRALRRFVGAATERKPRRERRRRQRGRRWHRASGEPAVGRRGSGGAVRFNFFAV